MAGRSRQLIALALATCLLVVSCTADPTVRTLIEPEEVAEPAAVLPEPTTPDPTPTESGAPIPEPTATELPEQSEPEVPTVEAPLVEDLSPVVVDGGEWVITQNDVDEMVAFIEETHELEFTAPVGVNTSDDIGRDFAAGFEPFSEQEWELLQALGLVEADASRDDINQLRRDRIRGVCCARNGDLAVVVELQPSKLATELIVVHELVHALHVQHPELSRAAEMSFDETPLTFAAATEGVPQYVAFAYLALATDEEQAAVLPDLPIIREDMMALIDGGAARHLNYAYGVGQGFVDAVVEERGVEGLAELISSPPTTNEQVLFPEKYLAGEEATEIPAPSIPDGAQEVDRGRIGVALWAFVLAGDGDLATQQPLLAPWAGDSYRMYNFDGQLCLVATIALDAPGLDLADELAESLQQSFPATAASLDGSTITLDTCGGR